MTRINLLPWREEHRQELQRQFFSVLGGIAILAGLCVYVVYSFYNGEINDQNTRNKFVEGKIAELETKITQIRELQDRRNQIVDSMKVIQELQGNRPVIVHAIGAIVSTVPDGLYYTKIEKKGPVYKMYGVAETNNKISKLMRNLNDSDWFKDSNLESVKGTETSGNGEDLEKLSVFELTVMQETPKGEDEQAEPRGGK
jgi:type IV pilus assembly protein PilN